MFRVRGERGFNNICDEDGAVKLSKSCSVFKGAGMIKESDILAKIKGNLPIFCRKIIHIDRLNSGSIPVGKAYIRMCVKGTPDLYAILDHEGGHVLFIEVKRPGGKQSDEQKTFAHMISKLEHVHYILATSVTEVLDHINKNIFDKKE